MAGDKTVFEYHPVTSDRWPDLDRLFSASSDERLGNPSRCWCMEWRLPHEQWQQQQGEGNRRAMEAFVASGDVPGILAYDGAEPVGWCSVSPRTSLPGLVQTGNFENPDNPDVWAIVCFYVAETQRGRGLAKGLLQAAVQYAIAGGAKIVEAYPLSLPVLSGRAGDKTASERSGLSADQIADLLAGGSVRIFADAGFVEAGRVSEHQVVTRYY